MCRRTLRRVHCMATLVSQNINFPTFCHFFSSSNKMITKNAPASFAKRKQVLKAGVDDVTTGHVFSLMSYNVLADCHTSPSTYPYRDSAHLDIKFRHQNLVEELRYSECDVICLQEVGPGYFRDTLEPELQKLVTYMIFRVGGFKIEISGYCG